MAITRRETMGLMGAAAVTAIAAGAAAPAPAQGARRLGSPTKKLYWVATVTPCDRGGKFDPGAMRAILQWHKSQGADGVVVLGTSGEFPSFSVAERKLVAETVLRNKMGLNIMVNPGTPNIAETIELAKHAEAHGADGMLVIPPFYFNAPPVEGLAAYYSMLLDQCGLPTSLYHIPGTSEVPITLDLLAALHHYPHLAGIKDSSGNAEGYQAFVTAYPDLNMRCGTSNNLETAISHGMGTILADGNTMSRQCADIFKAYRADGDWKTPLAKLREANAIMRAANGGANTYAVMKYVLSLEMGGPQTFARAPYVQLTDAQKQSLKAGLDKVRAMA